MYDSFLFSSIVFTVVLHACFTEHPSYLFRKDPLSLQYIDQYFYFLLTYCNTGTFCNSVHFLYKPANFLLFISCYFWLSNLSNPYVNQSYCRKCFLIKLYFYSLTQGQQANNILFSVIYSLRKKRMNKKTTINIYSFFEQLYFEPVFGNATDLTLIY